MPDSITSFSFHAAQRETTARGEKIRKSSRYPSRTAGTPLIKTLHLRQLLNTRTTVRTGLPGRPHRPARQSSSLVPSSSAEVPSVGGLHFRGKRRGARAFAAFFAFFLGRTKRNHYLCGRKSFNHHKN